MRFGPRPVLDCAVPGGAAAAARVGRRRSESALSIYGTHCGKDTRWNANTDPSSISGSASAEHRELQAHSVERFTALRDEMEAVLGFAVGHRDIVARFGRFPHRNAILGRASTAEEAAFLASGENTLS